MADLPFSEKSRLRIYLAEDDPLNNPDAEPLVEVEATVGEVPNYASPVTANPVEEGADVTDHQKQDPVQLTVSGEVGEAPIKILGSLRNIGEESPADRVHDEIRAMQNESKVLTIITGAGRVFDQMMVTNYSPPRSKKGQGKHLTFTLSLQEFQVAETETVPGLAAPVTEVGAAQTEEATEATQAATAENVSLFRLGLEEAGVLSPGAP